MSDTRYKKYRAERWGRLAEDMTAVFLMAKGYRIVRRRYKCKQGEIDLIAEKSRCIIAIEVKARATKDQAIEAVNHRKQNRVTKAMSWFLASDGLRYNQYAQRFDIVAISPWRWPNHLRNAW